ncbi:hypothetical protein G3R49_06320 [Shewanella sp. WXL01]|uniref:hypothetical protein n=1 Tax=Shewanella sp. WXL01 TaxID=2709721 RepID=UPI0014383E0F|nr:hypothetical protein [Shewanella sp. WXL01]NKF50185.1 hypothetical protein [Shewanella sp. WXL01]
MSESNKDKSTGADNSPDQAGGDRIKRDFFDEMPFDIRAVINAASNIDDQDVSNLVGKANDTLDSFIALMESDSKLKELLPEGVKEETLARELAKLPESQVIIEQERLEGAKVFEAFFCDLIDQDIAPDIEAARKLAAAKSITDALADLFPAEQSQIFNYIPEEVAELLQGAFVCHMAGLPDQAKLFYKIFTQKQFMNAPIYTGFQDEITKNKGAIELAKLHSQKGQDSRHSKNRKRKAYALELYKQRKFKNPKQAAERLFPRINEYAKSLQHPFSSEYQGFNTVYRWFLELTKKAN